MARKYLTPIDMNLLEIQNFTVQSLGSAPSLTEARLFYNSTTKKLCIGTDTEYVELGPSEGGEGLTTEQVEDIVGALIDSNSEITIDYVDGSSSLTISIDEISADKIVDGSTNHVFTAADDTKLAGIATGATANSADATLLARANHTGTQSADTLTDGTTNKAFLATERTKLSGIATSATANSSDATLLARANHTGTQAASTISDLASVVKAYRHDEFAAPTASVSWGTQKITNLLDPTSAQDAATKAYVDSVAQGLDIKQSVRLATTTPVTLASNLENGDIIDGSALATGDRVLVKNQTSGSENGIYTVNASGAPTRALDADSSADVTPGMFVFVENGTVNADTGWVLTNNTAITLGTTALTFTQFSGAGAYTAGAGLTQSSTDFAVGAGTGITVNANDVAIDTTVVVRKYATSIGNGTNTSYTVTHNLGTLDVTCGIFTNSDGTEVEADVTHATTNTLTIAFAVAPTTNQYRVVVHG